MDLVSVSRDATELRRWLYDLRYTAIASAGPCRPIPDWKPETSDRYLDFWRIFTRPIDTASGPRMWRIVPGQPPRALVLDEPPGLVELALPGDDLRRRGSLQAALQAYAGAHARAPGLALLFARSASCRLALGDAKGAVADTLRAVSRAGTGPEVLDLLGDAFVAAKAPARAAAAYEQAAGLDDTGEPGHPGARWLKAARALEHAGMIPAAREAVRRARSREPMNQDARVLAARLRAL